MEAQQVRRYDPQMETVERKTDLHLTSLIIINPPLGPFRLISSIIPTNLSINRQYIS